MSTLKLKLKKLTSMSPEEILFRTKEKYYTFTDRFEYLSKRSKPSNGSNGKKTSLNTFKKGIQRDRFFIDTDNFNKKHRIAIERFPWKKWLSEAEQILNGNLYLLGTKMDIRDLTDWHRDPVTGKKWLKVFYKDVYKSPLTDADIKYVWEINRHQYLIVLAKAYFLTGDEKYAEVVFRHIESWIEQNPYGCGVNWTSSLELAVRIFSWTWALFFCLNSSHLTEALYNKISSSIAEQAKYITRHLSCYFSPYNHLIGEAAGLYLAGSIYTEHSDSSQWKSLGWSILCEQAEKQFHPDGITVEQATFYHHFTLGFYLQCIQLRRLNREPIPDNVLKSIEKALEFSMFVTRPDGTIPMIGDVDNARSICFSTTHSWDFRGFLSLGPSIFNREDFKFVSDGVSEELLWLGSLEDLTHYENLSPTPPFDTALCFKHSGYSVVRSSWSNTADYILFDSGEIADGLFSDATPSAAHGHADALSFELTVKGKPFLIDPGLYTYFSSEDWHKYFRLESAHNTLTIKNHPQANYVAPLTWNFVKKPSTVVFEKNDHFTHMAGEIALSSELIHRRDLLYIENHALLLIDSFESSIDIIEYAYNLHFHPDVEVKKSGDGQSLIATNGEVKIKIFFLTIPDIVIEKGGSTPFSGWVAPGYGIKIASYIAGFKGKLHLSAQKFVPVLIVFNPEIDHIEFNTNNDSDISLTYSYSNKTYLISFSSSKKFSFKKAVNG